ncbi:DUF4288 domain-containing protein [Tissierella praeacuta]|uniref:DUF4288 domain-containing protein n=1 Tax=Tissierella praeacuta TaxID=43131 RepID=UPI00333E5C8A
MINDNPFYSVVLLKESIVSEIKNTDDTKIFEESILLVKLKKDFFEKKSQEELLLYFNENISSLEYINSYGEVVISKIVKVIDCFQVLDSIETENFTEVYSRHFIEKIGTTSKDIINKYYGGYVFI